MHKDLLEIQKTLLEAYKQNNVTVLVEILDRPECTTDLLMTPIQHESPLLAVAANEGNSIMVQALLDHSKYTTHMLLQQSWEGQSALLGAALQEHPETVRTILNHPKCTREALLQKETCEGETALTMAAKRAYTDIVLLVLDSPLSEPEDLIQENDIGYTALAQVSRYGHHNSHKDHRITLKALLNHPKCTTKILSESGALRFAAVWGNIDALQIILDHEKCTTEVLAKRCPKGNSPVMLATMYKEQHVTGPTDTLSTLLNHPKFIKNLLKQVTRDGLTPLMLAAVEDNLFISVSMLEEMLNSPHCDEEILSFQDDEHGNTALIWAILNGRVEKIMAILNSPHCTDKVLSITKNGLNAKQLALNTFFSYNITMGYIIEHYAIFRQSWDSSSPIVENIINLLKTFCSKNTHYFTFWRSKSESVLSVRKIIEDYENNEWTSSTRLSFLTERLTILARQNKIGICKTQDKDPILKAYLYFIESKLPKNQTSENNDPLLEIYLNLQERAPLM